MLDDPDVLKRISEINKSMLRLAKSIMGHGYNRPECNRIKPIAIPGSQIPKEKLCKKS